MTDQKPKAFDFGEEPGLPPERPAEPLVSPSVPPAAQSAAHPARPPVVPRAFDFGEAQEPAAPPPASPPRALSFDDLSAAPASAPATAAPAAAARALFDSEDHPAVRDALAIARADYPVLFAHSEGRFATLFRRILPLELPLVTGWAEAPLMEQAALLQPITEQVVKFTQMAVPALLESALESTRTPTGMLGKLFRRQTSPAQYKPALISSREQLVQLMGDSEVAMRNLEASAQNLGLHGAVLAVVSTLAGGADATLQDALTQRRTLIQQAVRQAELSILQMGQVRRQAADLIGQISSFLTVTLPALEMAQAQGGQ